MLRKIIIIVVTIGLAWSPFAYIQKANAFSSDVWGWIVATSTSIQASSGVSLNIKEYVLDTIARAVSRSLLNVAISGIINKIQTGGRDGGPAFVQNWRNFQTDAQYRGENVFRSVLAETNLCDYFGKDIKNLFGANQKVNSLGQNLRVGNFDPFALRANCTLPSNFNMTNYQKDFAGNGGWSAWTRMLEPQNNYYGTLFGSLDEAAKQRTLEQSGDINEALAGSGYTSIRDKNCAGTGAGAKCVFMGKIFTPGDLLGKSAANTIDSDLGWLVSSDELSEVIIAIGSAITNRLINLATSNTDNDYKNAPKVDDKTKGYLACINACPKADDLTCQTNCAKAWGYNVPQASTPPPDDGENSCPNLPATEPEPASLKAQVQAEIDKYTLPTTPEQQGVIMNTVAWNNKDSGWVLLGKAGGNNCPSPAGIDISCDYLVHQPTMYGYDIFSSEGSIKMKASWGGPDNGIECMVSKGSRSLVQPVQP